MKMVKSLLLGSAAGVVAVTGTQAADLPVKAKPVEYVKICSLYGDGFYYIPGTETCVRIGASTQGDYDFQLRSNGHPHYDAAEGANDRTTNSWAQRGRIDIGLDSRTQTTWGTLRSVVVMRMDNGDQNTVTPNATRAYIQWAGFTFGHTKSYSDPVAQWGGGADFRNLHQGQIHRDSGANGTNQISYTWELGNGMVLVFGADERAVGSLTNLSNANSVLVGANPATFRAGQQHPNPYVAWRGAQAWGSWSAAVLATDNAGLYYNPPQALVGTLGSGCPTFAQTGTTQCNYPSNKWGFAILTGIEFKLPFIAQGDRFGIFSNYGVGAIQYSAGTNLGSPGLYGSGNQISLGWKTDGVYVNGSGINLTTGWAIGMAYEHYWLPNLSTTVFGGRSIVEYNDTVINSRLFCGSGSVGGLVTQGFRVADNVRCDPGYKFWEYGVHTDWYPVPGFRLGFEIGAVSIESAFAGQFVTLSSRQGARPTGTYLAKDQSIGWVTFRAQRGFGGVGE